jgi:quercetin dioxygenase-like cupin family protein
MTHLSTAKKKTYPYPGLTRRILTHTPESMLVEHHMKSGSVFPWHSHRHEQTVFVVKGKLRVQTREGNSIKVRLAEAGDSWVVPGHVPHRVTALKPARVLDFFTPFREDFLDEMNGNHPHD